MATVNTNGTGADGAQPTNVAVADAIVRTVAYVDVFDYPLTAEEIHRYLVGVAASRPRVYELLSDRLLLGRWLERRDGYYTLAGREALVDLRRRRREIATRLWPQARHYGRRIGALPFVRMVAVTGSLAVDNAVRDADVDYLIVTEGGRLWLCRAVTILVVRLAALRGVHLCPNYFLSEEALVFQERNLYTAHELVQMVPIAGLETYRKLRQLNGWTSQFLPNAGAAPRPLNEVQGAATGGPLKRFAENVLRTRAGAWLESWERERKIARFSEAHSARQVEAAFCPDWCKGHFEGHGQRIMEAYESRLAELGQLSARP